MNLPNPSAARSLTCYSLIAGMEKENRWIHAFPSAQAQNETQTAFSRLTYFISHDNND